MLHTNQDNSNTHVIWKHFASLIQRQVLPLERTLLWYCKGEHSFQHCHWTSSLCLRQRGHWHCPYHVFNISIRILWCLFDYGPEILLNSRSVTIMGSQYLISSTITEFGRDPSKCKRGNQNFTLNFSSIQCILMSKL